MKASSHFTNKNLCILATLLLGISLTVSPTQAQTFRAQVSITPVPPPHIRAIITSLANSPLLIIRYENQDTSPVQVLIQDRRRNVFFDELRQARYAGEFDLSALPAGVYTIHLQTHQAHYQQTVLVDLLGGRYPVVKTNLPSQSDYFTAQNQAVSSQPIN